MPATTTTLEEALGANVRSGEVVNGKYRLQRVLASGGMGVVVKAHHLALDEPVAMKFLTPGERRNEASLVRFEREARAAFRLQSEHVCRIYDVGRHGELPFMVMEYLEGRDLGRILERQTPHATADAVGLVLQALEAVAEAHAHGIVHRDLKPENLFMARRPDGRPILKVLDFGLSKRHADAAADEPGGRERTVTRTQQIMGTPEYMAPEQWMSARDVGPASDQWSLGVILYELLTGLQPFAEENVAQLCARVLRGEVEPIGSYRHDVPAALEAAVRRTLAKDPEERYPHLGAFAAAIAPFGHAPEAMVRQRRIERMLNVTTALEVGEIALAVTDAPASQGAPARGEERARLAALRETELMMDRDVLAEEMAAHRAAVAGRATTIRRARGTAAPPVVPSDVPTQRLAVPSSPAAALASSGVASAAAASPSASTARSGSRARMPAAAYGSGMGYEAPPSSSALTQVDPRPRPPSSPVLLIAVVSAVALIMTMLIVVAVLV
ncbi:MAG: serine/threonine-protein kinase [Myxococcota bacterium]